MNNHELLENPPQVSFIIPVQDDATRLRRCLESISATDIPPTSWR
jgi:glycosyltransferase involved in cell wall biosynthesis